MTAHPITREAREKALVVVEDHASHAPDVFAFGCRSCYLTLTDYFWFHASKPSEPPGAPLPTPSTLNAETAGLRGDLWALDQMLAEEGWDADGEGRQIVAKVLAALTKDSER